MNKGYIAIITVLMLSAVSLMIAATVSLLAIGESQGGFAVYQGENNLSLVEGCAEDALMKSQASSAYMGGTILRPEGTCSIVMNSKAGTTWTITVTSTGTIFQRNIKVIYNRPASGSITITSWQEI